MEQEVLCKYKAKA